jgi:DMSO/TMAO reductase YedYZ molybdopterin-dependent catalytic subunit
LREKDPQPVVSRGFRGRPPAEPERLPPGQYLTRDFPVLATGPTPVDAADDWRLTISGAVERERSWDWEELLALPADTFTVDIHCVTQWTKLDTTWTGVPVDALLAQAVPDGATHLVAHCTGGYTTNLPLADVTGGRAWIAYAYEGEPLTPPHGGPARLLVPHLYFWKSAKWIRRLELLESDQPGYWEVNGYHLRGDPWREQRYDDD